jgi:hypothetical protein
MQPILVTRSIITKLGFGNTNQTKPCHPMKTTLQPLNLILLICIVFVSCKKEDQDGASFRYENDQLLCENFHPEQVKMDGEYVLMHNSQDIYVFKKTDANLKLIQKIGFTGRAGSFCMDIHRGMLAVGRSEALGNGKVYIYRFFNDKWELDQTLEAGKYQDNFGCSLDFNDSLLVIGADARWEDRDGYEANLDEGRVYVYRAHGTEWVQEAELFSTENYGDNRFGQTVAVHGNLVMAGPWLEIFQLDGTWKSLRTQYDIRAYKIYHDRDHFAITDDKYNGEFHLFTLEDDGTFTDNSISGASQYGFPVCDQACMKDDLMAFNFPYMGCLLYQFDNNGWNETAEIGTSYEVDIYTDVVEISFPYVILSGDVNSSQRLSKVYFYMYNK